MHAAPGTEGRQVYRGYWIFYDRDGSVSFGTETHEHFGSLPAEIVRAVPESSSTPLRHAASHARGRSVPALCRLLESNDVV